MFSLLHLYWLQRAKTHAKFRNVSIVPYIVESENDSLRRAVRAAVSENVWSAVRQKQADSQALDRPGSEWQLESET
jgi:hypothetical protein